MQSWRRLSFLNLGTNNSMENCRVSSTNFDRRDVDNTKYW